MQGDEVTMTIKTAGGDMIEWRGMGEHSHQAVLILERMQANREQAETRKVKVLISTVASTFMPIILACVALIGLAIVLRPAPPTQPSQPQSIQQAQ
jgi:hypothetical protein